MFSVGNKFTAVVFCIAIVTICSDFIMNMVIGAIEDSYNESNQKYDIYLLYVK